MQIDGQRASILVGREDYLLNEVADQLRGFASMLWLIQRGDETLHLDMVSMCHIWMNEHGRFRLSVDRRLQRQLALLQTVDLIPDEGRIDPVLNRFDQLRDTALGTLQLRAIGVQRRTVLDLEPVHVLSVFPAKDFAELWPHKTAAQRAEYGLLKFAFADCEPVVARAFVSRGRAPVLGSRHLSEAATAIAAFEQEGEQLLWAALRSMIAFLSKGALH